MISARDDAQLAKAVDLVVKLMKHRDGKVYLPAPMILTNYSIRQIE